MTGSTESPASVVEDPMDDPLHVEESNDVRYESNSKIFKKSSRPPLPMTRVNGDPFVWFRAWNHERITNEARALELVAAKTTIPVPRLLNHGTNPDGTRYITTERVAGVSLSAFRDLGCKRHTECCDCLRKAEANALAFIKDTVLPQLANLRSHERGIGGFVMPPSWLSEARPPWKGKGPWRTYPLAQADYVFQHGDLSSGNIMIDRATLQVTALIDWEHAGFFPPGAEQWKGILDDTVYNSRGQDVAEAIRDFFDEEYNECCDKWEDQEQLADLIKKGKLPPRTMKQP